MKQCGKCKTEQPFVEFRRCSKAADKLQSWCKQCFRENDRKRYKNTPRGSTQREYQKLYRKNNLIKTRIWSMERYMRKMRAIPKWLSEAQKIDIQNFYDLARDCEIISGEQYQVDHIIPLKGKNVCGLHVPWNLQVLPADINISKGNR